LLYQAALRTEDDESLINQALCKALATTQVLRDGVMYLIEVPDPLTMDRLRKRVRTYGFVSDGTFAGSIAKIPEGALIRLVEELIPEKQKSEITRQLIKGGLPDKTIAGALKAVLATVGKKVAGELGDQAGKAIGDEIGDILTGGWRALAKLTGNNS
jgi:hypothetical protein